MTEQRSSTLQSSIETHLLKNIFAVFILLNQGFIGILNTCFKTCCFWISDKCLNISQHITLGIILLNHLFRGQITKNTTHSIREAVVQNSQLRIKWLGINRQCESSHC